MGRSEAFSIEFVLIAAINGFSARRQEISGWVSLTFSASVVTDGKIAALSAVAK